MAAWSLSRYQEYYRTQTALRKINRSFPVVVLSDERLDAGCGSLALRISFDVKGKPPMEASPTRDLTLTPILSVLPALLGLLVIYGWAVQDLALIQVSPAFVPMQFNTALCFLLCGVGLFSAIRSRAILALGCGTVIAAIAVLTLFEYLVGANIGIDELFLEHYITTETPNPGRMGPNTAINFVLASGGLIVMGKSRSPSQTARIISILGAVIFGIGVTSVTGYAFGLESAHGWGSLPGMAVHTSAGFIAIGISFVFYAWSVETRHFQVFPVWLPFVAGIIIATITLSLWQALSTVEAVGNIQHMVLAFGLCFAALTSFAIKLMELSERRAGVAEARTNKLSEEHQERQRIEDRLQKSEMHYLNIFNTSPDGIMYGDEPGRPVGANQALLDMFGYTLEELHTKSPEELTPAKWNDVQAESIKRLLATGEPQEFEKEYIRKDGTHLPVNVRVWLRDPKDFGQGRYLARVQDITERKQAVAELAESEKKHRRLFETSPDGITFALADGTILEQNRAFCDMLGYSEKELLTLSYHDLTPPRWHEMEAEFVRKILENGEPVNYEKEYIHKDGHVFPVSFQTWSIKDEDGVRRRLMGRVQDITERKQAETLLQERALILEQIDYAVVTSDLDGFITGWYASAEEMYGWSAQEAIGQNITLLIPEQDTEDQTPLLRSEVLEKGVVRAELRRQRKNGEIFDGELSLSVQRDERGEPRQIVGVLRDITERKQAETLLQERALVLEQIDYAVVLGDLDGIITGWFGNAEGVFGWTEEEAIGQHLKMLLSDEDKEKWNIQFRPTVREQGSAAFETKRRRKSGDLFDAEISVTALHDKSGEITHFIGVVRDITGRKQDEAELIDAKAQAESASQAKSEFLASMSHELRTPLNAVLGYAQLSRLSAQENLDEHQRKFADQIMTGGEQLLSLINNVLELSSIEAGEFTISIAPMEPHECLKECVSLLSVFAKKYNVSLVYEPGDDPAPLIQADSERFKQVTLNFLGNAIKYNKPDGKVTLSWHLESESVFRVLIRDTGIGIPPEHQGELFEPFSRLGREGGEIEGTGIGLTITKQIVEIMGGTIGFESKEGEGSTFWFDLPVSTPEEVDLLAAGDEEDANQDVDLQAITGTVLYVENNRANLKLVEDIVAAMPEVRFYAAENGVSGLDLALREAPDLILSDLQMPNMDGYEFLAELRANPATRNIPTIAVTARAMPQEIEKARKAGFDECITKPIDVQRLINTVATYLPKS